MTLLFVTAWGGAPARAQPVDELIGAPGAFIDPEFKGLRVTYQNAQHQVMKAQVDGSTGFFLTPGTEIDTQATPMSASFQGPEWVRGTERIVYTKTPLSTPTLWAESDSGPEQLTFAPVSRYLLSGISTPGGSTKIVYRRIDSTGVGTSRSVSWLDTAQPGVEYTVPDAQLGVGPVTWIPDSEDMLYTRTGGAGGLTQIARYSTTLRTATWLTQDGGNKADAFSFHAPERANALVYAAVVDETVLRVYQDLNGNGTLGDTPGEVQELRPRSGVGLPYIYSPEVFQARDERGILRTWFVVILRNYHAGETGSGGRGEVWVWGLDNAFQLKVDGSSAENPRMPLDPEATAGQSEIFIYYSTPDLALWRIKTGLTPP